MRFFFFGLLRDMDMLELVIDRRPPAQAIPRARLGDARLVRLREETFPMLVRSPGEWVPGVIVEGLTGADVERIHFFESVEYEPCAVEVELLEGGRAEALAFAATTRVGHDDVAWRFEDWVARHKARDLREAELWMAFFGHLEIAEADRRWDEALAAGRSIEDLVREVCGRPRRRRC
jgi:hypothetical protein